VVLLCRAHYKCSTGKPVVEALACRAFGDGNALRDEYHATGRPSPESMALFPIPRRHEPQPAGSSPSCTMVGSETISQNWWHWSPSVGLTGFAAADLGEPVRPQHLDLVADEVPPARGGESDIEGITSAPDSYPPFSPTSDTKKICKRGGASMGQCNGGAVDSGVSGAAMVVGASIRRPPRSRRPTRR
jgi:hypothetical protein